MILRPIFARIRSILLGCKLQPMRNLFYSLILSTVLRWFIARWRPRR